MNRDIDGVQRADPLAALRTATDSRHELLDSGLAIGTADATLADYASHLRMLRAWLLPLSAALADHGKKLQPDTLAWLAGRLALIDADLAEPGMPASDDPPCAQAPWPADASAAWLWGVCYVVEGSQLGGAVLYQRLHARLAPHPLRYLKGDAAGPGPRWRTFMLALRQQVCTPAEIAETCAGACAAFDRILSLRGA
jgi:heme oxygenase